MHFNLSPKFPSFTFASLETSAFGKTPSSSDDDDEEEEKCTRHGRVKSLMGMIGSMMVMARTGSCKD